MKTKLISTAAFAAAVIAGCKGYQEVGGDGYKANPGTTAAAYSSAEALPKLTCKEGMSMLFNPDARVSWQITRFNTVTGQDLPFLGSNGVSGMFTIPNWELNRATAVLNFDISSTYSDDALRDERIHEFIFGKHKGQVLRFTLKGFAEENIILEDPGTENVTALGVLEVGGQATDIELPLLIKARNGFLNLTPSKIVKLNMRALSPQVNGFNIAGQIAQILKFVTNIEVKDEVLIDFNLELTNTCLPE